MQVHTHTHDCLCICTLTHINTHSDTQIALNKCPPSGGRLPWRLIQVRMMRAGHLLIPPSLVPADLCVDKQAAGSTFRENIEEYYVDFNIIFSVLEPVNRTVEVDQHTERQSVLNCDDRRSHTLHLAVRHRQNAHKRDNFCLRGLGRQKQVTFPHSLLSSFL